MRLENNVESIKSKAYVMEDRISKLEDRNIEVLQVEEERELRFLKSEEILQEISASIRKSNIRIIGIREGEEMEKGAECLFKGIIAENFPNLGKELDLQVNETNGTLNFINAKRPSPWPIILKMAKVNDKGKILRAAKQKKITYKGTSIRLSVDFLAETS
uniref:L1 transposable element RRM domain-containing protein n=1 Tax=Equus caballus TaxID=9796 RepID=A0A9L0R1U9_HORSE